MLLIFDCDGVLVDSEHLACVVESDYLTSLGMPVSVDEIASRFVGMSLKDMTALLSQQFGALTPPDFADELTRRTLARFEAELTEIAGVRAAIEALALPRCVASSSSPARIAGSLTMTGLIDLFEPAHIFSTSMVARGKPAPDIFLHAAREMSAAPAQCLVIEDSVAGLTGAVAAGMRTIGFTGGTHVRDKTEHGQRLKEAGATRVIDDMRALGETVRALSPASLDA